MKTLQAHRVSNNDHVGNCNFDLVKRVENVALYHRTNMDGSHRSYETFIVKVVPAGSPLPGGGTVEEDYESYPGAGSFGKTAYDCKTLEHAERRFDELLIKAKEQTEAREESERTGKPIPRGRKPSKTEKTVVVKTGNGKRGRKRVEVNFTLPPVGETFSMKQLVLSSGQKQALLYIRLRELIEVGKVVISGTFREEGQRGRDQVLYRVV
jgi:hypothetical protein